MHKCVCCSIAKGYRKRFLPQSNNNRASEQLDREVFYGPRRQEIGYLIGGDTLSCDDNYEYFFWIAYGSTIISESISQIPESHSGVCLAWRSFELLAVFPQRTPFKGGCELCLCRERLMNQELNLSLLFSLFNSVDDIG